MHEPHFCILREKMLIRSRRADAQADRPVAFQKTNDYQFMHIGLLREYLEIELMQVMRCKEIMWGGFSLFLPSL
jgi:5'-3' exonuclease